MYNVLRNHATIESQKMYLRCLNVWLLWSYQVDVVDKELNSDYINVASGC